MEFSIITLIIGILGFVLGFMVRKYIMGSHVMVFGLCLSAIAGINYVLKNRYPYIITITIIVMAVATEFGAYYRICKYAKLED